MNRGSDSRGIDSTFFGCAYADRASFEVLGGFTAHDFGLIRQADAKLGQQPEDALVAVRSTTKPCRARFTINCDCCSSDFIGTNRMASRCRASQMAATSAASLLRNTRKRPTVRPAVRRMPRVPGHARQGLKVNRCPTSSIVASVANTALTSARLRASMA